MTTDSRDMFDNSADYIADEILVLAPGPANTWDGAVPERICRQVTQAELHGYRCPPGVAVRGRALVCAGGGYLQLMHDKEGVEVARWLNTLGIEAWVLLHRLPGQDDGAGAVWPFDIALRDGRAAVAALAARSPALPLLHVGLSSGGHLAGAMACQADAALPAAGLLIAYAPINANHRDHKAPAGKPDYPPPEKQAFYDAWPIGIAARPHGMPPVPVFAAYALHDPVVPVEHALNLARSLRDAGGDVDLHVFADAPHGFALRDTEGTHAQWPALAARWIERRLA